MNLISNRHKAETEEKIKLSLCDCLPICITPCLPLIPLFVWPPTAGCRYIKLPAAGHSSFQWLSAAGCCSFHLRPVDSSSGIKPSVSPGGIQPTGVSSGNVHSDMLILSASSEGVSKDTTPAPVLSKGVSNETPSRGSSKPPSGSCLPPRASPTPPHHGSSMPPHRGSVSTASSRVFHEGPPRGSSTRILHASSSLIGNFP